MNTSLTNVTQVLEERRKSRELVDGIIAKSNIIPEREVFIPTSNNNNNSPSKPQPQPQQEQARASSTNAETNKTTSSTASSSSDDLIR